MKPKLLCILHLPPPIHGASMVGEYIKKSSIINHKLNIRYVNLSTSKSLNDIGKSGFPKLFRFIILLYEVMFQMIIFRPNKVYLTLTAKGIGFYKDCFVVLIAKIFGGNMVYHFHNKGVRSHQHKFFDNLLYKFVLNGADIMILSEKLYPDVEKYVPRNKVFICPNGIPETIYPIRDFHHKSINKPVQLLFLSNLIESKGLFILIEACRLLKNKHLPFTCVIVGGEGDISEQHLNKKIEGLGLENEISYLGKKYNEEKKSVFLESDIFVFPTYYDNETFGLVNIEAMQANLPVISTPEGGISDVVDDGITGFLVPKKDIDYLAERLEELIINPQKRKEMGQKGFEKFKDSFTLQIFERRFTEIIQEISVL